MNKLADLVENGIILCLGFAIGYMYKESYADKLRSPINPDRPAIERQYPRQYPQQ